MSHVKIRIIFLGTGTSVGVPVPGCDCAVCSSLDPRNSRLRCSVLIEPIAETSPGLAVLIDTTPDLRTQILRYGYRDLGAVFFTHAHADHINGIDDLRPFNFKMGSPIKVYADDSAARQIIAMFSYAFHPDPLYEGGAPPRLNMNVISMFSSVTVGELEIIALPIFHGSKQITGYRIGNFAYLTDCSRIPHETIERLTDLDLLVVSGLRYRNHKTHFTLDEAIAAIEKISPKKALLTHISHELEHVEAENYLRTISSCDIALAYDGLTIVQ